MAIPIEINKRKKVFTPNIVVATGLFGCHFIHLKNRIRIINKNKNPVINWTIETCTIIIYKIKTHITFPKKINK